MAGGSFEIEGPLNFGFFMPQGDTFLTLAPAGEQTPEPIRVIRNWQALLEDAD